MANPATASAAEAAMPPIAQRRSVKRSSRFQTRPRPRPPISSHSSTRLRCAAEGLVRVALDFSYTKVVVQ